MRGRGVNFVNFELPAPFPALARLCPAAIGKAPALQYFFSGVRGRDEHVAGSLVDRHGGLALGTGSLGQAVGGGVAPPCDRACMTGLVDRYLEALVRHDASGLPLNRDVKQLPYGTPSGWGE
jgi:hypothetical protein